MEVLAARWSPEACEPFFVVTRTRMREAESRALRSESRPSFVVASTQKHYDAPSRRTA